MQEIFRLKVFFQPSLSNLRSQTKFFVSAQLTQFNKVVWPRALGIGTAETPRRLRISLAKTAPWLTR